VFNLGLKNPPRRYFILYMTLQNRGILDVKWRLDFSLMPHSALKCVPRIVAIHGARNGISSLCKVGFPWSRVSDLIFVYLLGGGIDGAGAILRCGAGSSRMLLFLAAAAPETHQLIELQSSICQFINLWTQPPILQYCICSLLGQKNRGTTWFSYRS
jgi:hypothetical protein